MSDFINCFVDELNSLTLPLAVSVGILSKNESIAVSILPGGKTVQTYYDGTKEKVVNIQVSIKMKNQPIAYNTLQSISEHVENLESLESQNNSFEFIQIINSSEPFHRTQDESGNWILLFNTQAQIIH